MKSKKEFMLISMTIIFFLLSVFSLSILLYQKDDESKSVELVDNNDVFAEEDVKKFKVEIKGEVISPGVYEVEDGSIVMDLINASGGLTSNAYVDNINLSKRLSEEMVIIIYNKKDMNKSTSSNKTSKGAGIENKSVYIDEKIEKKESVIDANNANSSLESENNSLININMASKEELMNLPGIGESKALKIIEYREQNGGFKALEEITNVNGIGKSTYAKFKEYITI